MGWIFECYAQDTYDFGLDKDISYEEIFTKGLKHMLGNYKGKIANNGLVFAKGASDYSV
ncbi:hypothetical protein ACS3UN_12310 [Oscillospiraceae bacterium LTW-04]|nr:hypothetical protein RBH76_14055 [Oscillospiraceae bacterium MB24-C1]WMJ83869.1 hypothetical protein RBH76_00110 [Oscillospiraceae bacterium MB24-C1]